MILASQNATTRLLSDLWAQVRALADSREVDLDLRLLGKPEDVPPDGRDVLSHTVEAVIQSASTAQELHHIALELNYQPDALSVRIEHDGTLDAQSRSATEQDIFSCYGDIGALGGMLAISSGRGFGIRLELTLPYGHEGVIPFGDGERYFEPQVRRAPARVQTSIPELVERLTPQEDVCLSLLAAGLSNKEIAVRMNLGVGTVKFHLAQIYQKLGVQGRGRGAAVARARELGLLFD
jgi:DNA-binding CsgD family transcriptional regulator